MFLPNQDQVGMIPYLVHGNDDMKIYGYHKRNSLESQRLFHDININVHVDTHDIPNLPTQF